MEFKTIHLGQLYDVASGLSKSAKEFGNGGWPFVSFKTIFNNYFLPDEIPDVANTTEKEREKCSVRAGDIFLTRTSETMDELGMSSVALKDYPNATFNGFSKRLRLKWDNLIRIYPQYIGYYLRSTEFRNQITAMSCMSTRASLNIEMINRLFIRLPVWDTQVKIGDFLYLLDEKIKNNNQINRNLLEQLNSFYTDLSTREKWEYVAIGDLAEKIAMGPFGSNIKVSTFVTEGIPIISGNHLRGYFLEEPSYNYITEEHAEKLKNSNVFPKDVIFTHAGNIGQVAMIPKDCDYKRYVISQRQFYLRCNTEKLLPEYVTLFFHSSEGQHELLSYANQVGVPSIAQPASNLKKIQLPLPPIEIQKEWLKIVEPMIEMYQKAKHENKKLTDLRDSLLPKLMTGELDVSDLDI